MTDFQFYMAIGVPSFAVLLGMIMNGLLFQALNARITAVETRMLNLENKMHSLEATFNVRFDLLMSKLSDLDSRLSVLEDRSRH